MAHASFLVLTSFLLGSEGAAQAVALPTIVTGEVDEPIVSCDGIDIQVAHVVLDVPGKLTDVKSLTIMVTSPDVAGHALGQFTWTPGRGFFEQTGPRSGHEFVNLLPTDVNNPDTTSIVEFDPATDTATVTYRWTLNEIYGSTFGNDVHVSLKTKNPPPPAPGGPVAIAASSSATIDSNFDTNSPPVFDPVEDFTVIGGQETVTVTLGAVDPDGDPFVFVPIELKSIEFFDGVDTFSWSPTLDDIGSHSIQFVANDEWGSTTLDFWVHVLDEPIPETGSWATMSTAGQPENRSYTFSLVWTGSEAIVWGGSVDGLPDASGGRYDPATDTWSAMATNDLAVSAHFAAWTGAEMITWAGYTNDGVTLAATNEGRIYNPATDSWRAMTNIGAPGPRVGASAVWSGSELIVWGGATTDSPPAYFSDGARYDPETDTWAPIAPPNALAPRANAGAVLTGGRMAVWGGSSYALETGNVYYADGELYDPVIDSWETISSINAPEGRAAHAMWSSGDDTFLVWGGISPLQADSLLNTGGRYDRFWGTWNETSLVDDPGDRTAMAYGGADDLFVVWGGVGIDTAILATGGVYNQWSQTWLATSMTGAPNARQGHKGVWIDTGLLVWGGTSFFFDGSTYLPVPEPIGGIFTP